MENEREFLERRAEEERSAASTAKGAKSRKVHGELADNYEQRLLGSSKAAANNMERNIIERALELAPKCRSLPELKSRLKSEGYTSLDAHFHGKHIKNQIKELLEGGRLSLPVRPSARKDDGGNACFKG